MRDKLSQEEYKRYNRHLILENVGLDGQEKLKQGKVLVIGAGGLGCPILQYLTAAGVGEIGIIDFDTVDLSNLQRQILFTPQDIGLNKAKCAAQRLQQLNSCVKFNVYQERLTNQNAINIFQSYDVIVDGSDNFSTRYLVNDAAVLTDKPLVYGSIFKFQGQISVFNYKNGPSYRCLFPVPPKAGTIKNCSEIGVIGVLPGVVGTQQANEVIKILLEIGESLSGKLLIYDALKASFLSVGITRNENEIEKVKAMANQFPTFDYDVFCGIEESGLDEKEIAPTDLMKYLGEKNVGIVDLREEWETPNLSGDNVKRITMNELNEKIDYFRTYEKIILVCQTGARSTNVRTLLEQRHGMDHIVELKDGMQYYDN